MYLLSGDIHFGYSNFSKTVFEKQIGYFENEVFPMILNKKITDVYIVKTDLEDYLFKME